MLRHLAKVTINPAIAHGLAHDVGSLEIGKLADLVSWQPELFAVRPDAVVKMGQFVYRASGDPNGATFLCEPVLTRPQVGFNGGAPARLSVAFLAGCAMDADLPMSRGRSLVHGCRDVMAHDMRHNTALAEIRVDPRTQAVTVDGEPVDARAVEEVAMSHRFVLA